MFKDTLNTFFIKWFGPSRSAAQQIIATCVLVFLLAWLIILITLYPTSNRIISRVLLDWLKFSPLELSQGFKFLSPFTYMFLHLNAWHLLGNMLWLYFVGAILEDLVGKEHIWKLFVFGGVNYEPYRKKMENLIGRKVDSIELFPASEGFFAYQDLPNPTNNPNQGMLLLLNSGIFYEFIPADQFYDSNPPRLTISEVKLGLNYVMIVSTNAGLWGYNVGDTIAFTSLKPYRIIVTGRIKHFISAFGEHVIAKEVEQALQEACVNTSVKINEFTVAPQVNAPDAGLPYHEWFIEFEQLPQNLGEFSLKIDEELQKQNSYYFDLREGNILRPLVISQVAKNGFQDYMKSIGKLGGQNKVARLSNDRKIADQLKTKK